MRYANPKNSRSHKSRIFNSRITFIALAAFALLTLAATSAFMAGISGAIFTTDAACTGTDLNIYDDKADVYIDGGPAHPGAAGLPDGDYCVQVTSPDGTVLGMSAPGAVHVTDGSFDTCYNLSTILNTASSGFTVAGYDDTDNPGGEYKVWVSTDCDFLPDNTKTDNFKVKACVGPDCVPAQPGNLSVIKFYDADTSGTLTAGDTPITGWEVHVGAQATFGSIFETKTTPVSIEVDPGCYTAQEGDATGWIHTNALIQSVAVPASGTGTIEFGNVCLGGGGGLTLGFWSNKNGQALVTQTDINNLNALCLRDASGADITFVGTLTQQKTALKNFLLGATATNMSNMLSAQLAAMYLNVAHGFVNGGALIFAGSNPAGCSVPVNGAGFITVSALLTDAEAELCADGFTPSGDPDRACQEFKKTALDKANNNLNFVQSAEQCGVPTSFTYDASATAPECP
jgi:hypothetical protein